MPTIEIQTGELIKEAIELGVQLSQGSKYPFFTGDIEALFKGTDEISQWSPTTGIVTRDTLMTSHRDTWNRLCWTAFNQPSNSYDGLPRIEIKRVEGSDEMIIRISSNNVGGTDFHDRVLLSGVNSIILKQDGSLESEENGTTRSLTENETNELNLIFQDGIGKLRQVEKSRGKTSSLR